MAALIPDKRWAILRTLNSLLTIEIQQALTGTSAATYSHHTGHFH